MLETANPLGSAEVFIMDKTEALQKYREYAQAARTRRRLQDAAMRDVYRALSQGRGVLNINAAIKKAGVDKKTMLPLLAILRADEREVWFKRFGNGAGRYGCRQYLASSQNTAEAEKMRQYWIPEGTLLTWLQIPKEERTSEYEPRGYYDLHRAPAPVIPPQHRPPDSLSKYWLLWHVNEWKRVAPVDPMLLLPVGALGLGIVVAHWDLSPVERMVMGALLGN